MCVLCSGVLMMTHFLFGVKKKKRGKDDHFYFICKAMLLPDNPSLRFGFWKLNFHVEFDRLMDPSRTDFFSTFLVFATAFIDIFPRHPFQKKSLFAIQGNKLRTLKQKLVVNLTLRVYFNYVLINYQLHISYKVTTMLVHSAPQYTDYQAIILLKCRISYTYKHHAYAIFST